jgi:arylsulfatase A-like enzyme
MILRTARFAQALLLVVGFVFTASALQATPKPPRVKHVFIISYDQGNPSLMQRTELPSFHQMAAAGARTWEAYTIVPSITLPSHVSMLTGVGIQKHQITWNDHQPAKGYVKVPTIFSLAKERGLKTAMFVGKEKLKTLEIPGTIDVLVWPQPNDDAKSVAKAFAAEFGKDQTQPHLPAFPRPGYRGPRHRRLFPGKNSIPQRLRRSITDDQKCGRSRRGFG